MSLQITCRFQDSGLHFSMQAPAIDQVTARGTTVANTVVKKARIPPCKSFGACSDLVPSPADVVGDDRHAGRGFVYDWQSAPGDPRDLSI